MAITNQPHDLLASLEDLLVQEFRTLQTLISLTKEERQYFANSNTDTLMLLVEQKETVLDQIGLMEESRRMLTQDIAGKLGVALKSSTLNELYPFLEPAVVDRLKRLHDGILALVGQARDLNFGNKALVQASLEWLESAQAFLLGCCNQDIVYSASGVTRAFQPASGRGFDQRV
ncbi:MAG: flagellar protein FlgN [Chloroflexi bacterium]|jgi:flagellar biosynthesis/type III secretory pathway chaperone|nr:flagellar protein FlgN [Anaerolineaceae bacterium]NMB87700.1 flagellar protein FlgN [Chloroflexota bacterium]